MSAPTCPTCRAPMRQRTGSRGPFWGCSRYRDGCRGTRPIESTSEAPSRPAPRPAAPPASSSGPSLALVNELREAVQHLGAAAAILARVAPRLDAELGAADTADAAAADDEVPF